MKRSWWIMILALNLCASTGCALLKSHRPSNRMVTVNGVEISAEKAGHDLFKEAMDARQDKNDETAKHLLAQVIKKYHDTTAAHLAYVELGRLFLDHQQPEKAQRILEVFLVKHPYTPAGDEARYLLALSQMAQGNTDSAAPQLDTIVEKAGGDAESKSKALELAQELEEKSQNAQAVRYYAQAHRFSDDAAEQNEIAQKFEDLLENNVGFTEVRRLYETERSPPVLRELLSMKMAKIHLHLQDQILGQQVMEQYLREFPQGRFADDLKSIQKGLAKQRKIKMGRIGLLLPMTGSLKAYGERILTAVQMGLGMDTIPFDGSKLIQTKGAITLITLNTRGDAQRALAAMDRLVNKYQIMGVIGDPAPDTALPLALRAQAYQVPLISLSHRANLPLLGPYVFRLGLTPEKQAQSLANISMDILGHRRFAIVYPRHQYGLNMMHAFWNAVQSRQGEVTAIEDYGFGQTTFTSEAKKLVGRYFIESRKEYLDCRKAALEVKDSYRRKKAFERCKDQVPPIVDFDAVLIPDQARTVSYVVPALVAEDVPVSQDRRTMNIYRKTTGDVAAQPIQLLGGSTWNNDKLAQRLSKNGEGALFVDGFSSTDARPMVQEFVETFKGHVGSAPSRLDAQAFDAARLFHYVLEGKGNTGVTNRATLQQAILTVQGLEGVTGEIVFDANGESQNPLLLFQFAKGVIQPTSPETLVTPEEGGG